jgi:Phage integrase family
MNAERQENELEPIEAITLHEARHTFASLMIAAGVNAKALSTYMGHSPITITYDRYGHLMPGNEDEAAALLDTYLSSVRASCGPVRASNGRISASCADDRSPRTSVPKALLGWRFRHR